MNRRGFLQQSCYATVALGTGAMFLQESQAAQGVPMAQAFDSAVSDFMSARKVPGGSLAVVKDGRLVYVRAYGWADRDNKVAVQPSSLFRIASISKPFTAAAVIKLVAAGGLEMDTPAFACLRLEPLTGRKPDPRLSQITVRHLLHHTGGWDRDQSGDPMFMSEKIAHANGQSPPANQQAIIRYMLGQPLDFTPGARCAYSNFGYCVLGRIIEKISGLRYSEFVQKEVLRPIGIRHMRLGASRLRGRAPGEVRYYMPAKGLGPNESNSEPYTGFHLEAMDSHGGWLASAVDLARFAAALDDSTRAKWLPAEARRLLYEPPAPPVNRNPDGSLQSVYYACGWDVRRASGDGRNNYWHNGSLPGTFTLLVRRHDGLSWAMLLNQRSNDPHLPDGAIDGALHRAANAVAVWPSHDLFSSYD